MIGAGESLDQLDRLRCCIVVCCSYHRVRKGLLTAPSRTPHICPRCELAWMRAARCARGHDASVGRAVRASDDAPQCVPVMCGRAAGLVAARLCAGVSGRETHVAMAGALTARARSPPTPASPHPSHHPPHPSTPSHLTSITPGKRAGRHAVGWRAAAAARGLSYVARSAWCVEVGRDAWRRSDDDVCVWVEVVGRKG
jgi:hypothetical protein